MPIPQIAADPASGCSPVACFAKYLIAFVQHLSDMYIVVQIYRRDYFLLDLVAVAYDLEPCRREISRLERPTDVSPAICQPLPHCAEDGCAREFRATRPMLQPP